MQQHEKVKPMDGAGGSFGRMEEARRLLSASLCVTDILSSSVGRLDLQGRDEAACSLPEQQAPSEVLITMRGGHTTSTAGMPRC